MTLIPVQPLQLSIYKMLIAGVRKMDGSMGLLKKLCDIFDQAWEDFIYDPCSKLLTLFDLNEVESRWLPLLKPLFGFTDDMSFKASLDELRKILTLAIPYWNAKPSELGVIDYAIRMVSGNRYKIRDYFDLHMVEGETCLCEELEDFDPNCIDFPCSIYMGSDAHYGTFLGVPVATRINFVDLPTSSFISEDDFAWVQIVDTLHPANNGNYKIQKCLIGTKTVILKSHLALPPHGDGMKWKLLGWMDDFITEVRLVDEGLGTLDYDNQTSDFTVGDVINGATSHAKALITADSDLGITGTLTLAEIKGRFLDNETITGFLTGSATVKGSLKGVLNRELLAFLMGNSNNTVRPFSERIDVIYIDFLDEFITPYDLDQWVITGNVTLPSPGGYALFAAGGRLRDVMTHHDHWKDQCTAWKLIPLAADNVIQLTFMGASAVNHYFVQLDNLTKTIRLYKKVAAVDTMLATAACPMLLENIQACVRVDALKEGTGTRIRVKYNGELMLDFLDDPAAFSSGGVGAYASTGAFQLSLVEVNCLPCEIDRIGPNP